MGWGWNRSRVGWCLGLLALLAVVLVADGRTQPPAVPAPPGGSPSAGASGRVVEAGEIHREVSRVYIFVGKTGLGHEHAVVGQIKQGAVRLDGSGHHGEIVFAMDTFTADTDAARKHIGLEGTKDASTQQQVTANMRGSDVLDVQRFPTATFAITSVQPQRQPSRRGLPQYQLDGDFTLHGVTRPIRVVADVEEANGWLHLRGGFSILQTQFGITPYTKAFGAVGVTDRLDIWGDLWVAKERGVVQQASRPVR